MSTITVLRDYPTAAQELGLPETWLRRNIRRLPHEKYGKYVKFGPEHIAAIRKLHTVVPAAGYVIAAQAGPADLVPR